MVDKLRSRKFWAAIAGVISVLLIGLVPALEPLEDNIIEIITILGIYIVSQAQVDKFRQ